MWGSTADTPLRFQLVGPHLKSANVNDLNSGSFQVYLPAALVTYVYGANFNPNTDLTLTRQDEGVITATLSGTADVILTQPNGGDLLIDVPTHPFSAPVFTVSSTPSSTSAPYSGPLLQEFSSRTLDVCTPKSITITGIRLLGATASVQGKSVTVLENTDTKLVLAFPAGLTPGNNVDLVINSSSGTLTHQDAFDIPADTCTAVLSKGRWTQLQSDGKTVKIYAKDPIGDGKIQFFVDGKEIAWVNAIDEADPKLSFASSYPYLVRSVALHEGKNRFEIKLDGVRVWRATYVPKG